MSRQSRKPRRKGEFKSKMHPRQYHEVCELFPRMGRKERAALEKDICEHGQNEPIILDFEGRIVDGRNRFEICESLGLTPAFITLPEGTDVLTYALSQNLYRRHLSDSQKSMVAAKAIQLQKKAGMIESKRGRPRKAAKAEAEAPAKPKRRKKSVREAMDEQAEALKISTRLIETAGAVLERGAQELVTAVEDGHIAVSAAEALTELPVPEQQQVIQAGPEAVAEKVREIRPSKLTVSVGTQVRLRITDADGWKMECPCTVVSCDETLVLVTTTRFSPVAPDPDVTEQEQSACPWLEA